jgi:hypothetical protein
MNQTRRPSLPKPRPSLQEPRFNSASAGLRSDDRHARKTPPHPAALPEPPTAAEEEVVKVAGDRVRVSLDIVHVNGEDDVLVGIRVEYGRGTVAVPHGVRPVLPPVRGVDGQRVMKTRVNVTFQLKQMSTRFIYVLRQ